MDFAPRRAASNKCNKPNLTNDGNARKPIITMHKLNRSLFLLSMTSLVSVPFLQISAHASQGYVYNIIRSFDAISDDPQEPTGTLIQGIDGNFYGASEFGGSAYSGTVFKMTPSGSTTILHSFNDGSVPGDGNTPGSSLLQTSDGTLYGTTPSGGTAGHGVIFKVRPGGTYSLLHTFGDSGTANEGSGYTISGLVQGLDGNFYGTTYNGGSTGLGTVFKMTPDGTVTVIHTFADGSVSGDGKYPQSGLTRGADGNFYGTTNSGGTRSQGTIYQITPGGTVTILHSFNGYFGSNDGAFPTTGLTLGSDGSFYGTTSDGGSRTRGAAYKMAADGTFTFLHSFGYSEGSQFNGLTEGSDGNFYGTANSGGSTGNGTIYKMTPGGVVTTLHSFAVDYPSTDGLGPRAGLILGSDGNFYGSTFTGGSGADLPEGTAFRLSPANLAISTSATPTAGTPFTLNVKTVNDAGNVVTDYAGTLRFTSTDPSAVLPSDTTLVNGVGTFSSTLYTAAPITIRARDTASSDLTNTANVTVNPAAFTHLSLTTPATANTGTAFYATLTALDAYNNTVKSFADTIHVTSTSTQSVLPADFVLTNGAKQISAKLNSPGNQTITATDTNNSTAFTSGNINVGNTAAKLIITGSSTSIAGNVATYTVTAQDTVGNAVPGYNGTIHITSTDTTATLPADITLVNGVGTFNVTLKKATTSTVTATDTAIASLKATAVTVVSAATASQFTVAAPATTTANTALQSQITAVDAYGNVAKGYTGTVHFTSTDSLAVLPADVTLPNGTRQVTVKLKTAGSQTFTATDAVNAGITATSTAITVH